MATNICLICSKQYLCNKKECKPIKYSTLHKDNYGVPRRMENENNDKSTYER